MILPKSEKIIKCSFKYLFCKELLFILFILSFISVLETIISDPLFLNILNYDIF